MRDGGSSGGRGAHGWTGGGKAGAHPAGQLGEAKTIPGLLSRVFLPGFSFLTSRLSFPCFQGFISRDSLSR